MKVIIDVEFTDEERERITEYSRKVYGIKGLPKLATRKTLKEFVSSAVNARLIDIDAALAGSYADA